MGKNYRLYAFIFAILILLAIFAVNRSSEKKDNWHYSNGEEIVCRYSGCGNRPLYTDWENRFCAEHIDKSSDHTAEYKPETAKKRINTTKALTKEEADALRGTGYHGTKPNSSAENMELAAAMVVCKNCGMHSDNGKNSLCDECQYNKDYGLDWCLNLVGRKRQNR